MENSTHAAFCVPRYRHRASHDARRGEPVQTTRSLNPLCQRKFASARPCVLTHIEELVLTSSTIFARERLFDGRGLAQTSES